jgi:hypothetical protein
LIVTGPASESQATDTLLPGIPNSWQIEMGLLLVSLRVQNMLQPVVVAQALAHICKADAASTSGGMATGKLPVKEQEVLDQESVLVLP